MLLYSIVGLHTDHFEERINNIKKIIEDKTGDCILFMMQISPDSQAPKDKIQEYLRRYDAYKERLDEFGIDTGILVQQSLSHCHATKIEFPFQRYEAIKTGVTETAKSCCPYDKGFQEYMKNAFYEIAQHSPKMIMLDDDWRLMEYRPGRACACPLHMKEIIKRSGRNLLKEELYELIESGTKEGERLKEIMIKTQGDAVIEAVKAMRSGVDLVDKKIPISYCCCGNSAEFAAEIATIFAGEGNPKIVRINNGNYFPMGTDKISSMVSYRGARQIEQLKDKVDIILAETDTCVHNRYFTSASTLHTNFVAGLLEGTKGAKQWITCLRGYEPESEEVYRNILAENSGMYKKIEELVPDLEWVGCRIPITKHPDYGFYGNFGEGWYANVLEKFGFPLYFSSKEGGAVFLDSFGTKYFTDDEMLELLKGTVFLSSTAAKLFVERGFEQYLGVRPEKWDGDYTVVQELFDDEETWCMAQCRPMELKVLDNSVKIDSYVFEERQRSVCYDKETNKLVMPAVTVYKNSLGGTVITFCGTPDVSDSRLYIASLLNSSRKRQLARLLHQTGNLPIYYPGDAPIYLKTANLPDNSMFCTLFNLGVDTLDNVVLETSKNISSIKMLLGDGTFTELDFEINGNKIIINKNLEVHKPLILILH